MIYNKVNVAITAFLGFCFLVFCHNIYCETRTDAILQNDILSNLVRVDPDTGNLINPEVVSQNVIKVKNDQETGKWQKIIEEWVISWGKEEMTFIIILVPAEDGGVNYTIVPKNIAEEHGLLE